MAHPPSQISLTSPIAEYALRELARDGSSSHPASSAEEPLLSAIETSLSLDDTREINRIETSDRSGILDESFDCSFHEAMVQSPRPRFAFQSSLNTAINRHRFYRTYSDPANPHNTPASSSDGSSDHSSIQDQDGGLGRTQSASAIGRCAPGWLQNDSAWINTCHATDYDPNTSNLRTQPPHLEVESGISSSGERRHDANNANNIEDETASPGESLLESSPSISPHVRFADHPAKQRSANNSPSRQKKPLWRALSFHKRHPRRVSCRSPEGAKHVSISHLERSSERLPLPGCHRQKDFIDEDLPSSQPPIVASSAGGLKSSKRSDDNAALSSRTDSAIQQEEREVATVTVSLHKSHDSIWASSSGLSAIHMRINWSIGHPTSIIRQFQIHRMEGASNIGQVNLIIPVRLLQMIGAITIASQKLFSTRVASTVLKLAASVTSLVIASAVWLMERLWVDTSGFRLELDFGEQSEPS